MQFLTYIIIWIAILFAGLMSITQSSMTMAVPVFMLALALSLRCIAGKIKFNKIDWVVAVGMIYFLARAMLSPVKDLGEKDMFLILGGWQMYLLVSNGSAKWRFRLIYPFIVLYIINLLMLIPAVNAFGDDLMNYRASLEYTGVYNHRNYFSNFIATLLILFIPISFLTRFTKFTKSLYLVLILIGLVALYLAGSRGALVGAFGGLGLLACIYGSFMFQKRENQKKLLILSLIALPLIVLGGIYLVDKLANQAERGGEAGAGSLNVRPSYWSMAVDQVPDAPIFGSGSSSYSYQSYLYWNDKIPKYSFDHIYVHNEFLQALCDYGLVGLLIIIILLVLHIRYFIPFYISICEFYSNNGKIAMTYAMPIAGLAATVPFLIHSLVSFPAHCLPNLMLLALCFAWIRKYDDTRETKIKYSLYSIAVTTAVIVCALFVSQFEIRGALPFWKRGIRTDDLNWVKNRDNRADWKSALEESLTIAHSYNRYKRLGYIYDEEITENPDNEELIQKKQSSFLNAIKRHPYDSVSMLFLANSYAIAGNYGEANKWYKQAEPYFEHREHFLLGYQQWAYYTIQEFKENNDPATLNEANLLLDKALMNRDSGDQNVLEIWKMKCYVLNERLESSLAEPSPEWQDITAILDQIIDDTQKVSRIDRLGAFLEQIESITLAAERIWKRRKPTLAKKYYLKSDALLREYKRIAMEENLSLSERYYKISRSVDAALKVFKDANIQ